MTAAPEMIRRAELDIRFKVACLDAVKRIAAGHNNPRDLCEEILKEYKEILPDENASFR